jgi:Fur family peroxide stress response transcriptional regulator
LKSFQIAWRALGLKLTAPRRVILEALEGDRSHPSAEQVLARVRKRRPGISFTTVYATLEALVRHGLLSRVTADPSRARFDTVTAAHDHVVCDRCGTIRDVAAPRRSLRGPRGFRVSRVQVEFHGTCGACDGRD